MSALLKPAHDVREERIRQTVFLARQRLAPHSIESLLLASSMDQCLADLENKAAFERLKTRIPEDLYPLL